MNLHSMSVIPHLMYKITATESILWHYYANYVEHFVQFQLRQFEDLSQGWRTSGMCTRGGTYGTFFGTQKIPN